MEVASPFLVFEVTHQTIFRGGGGTQLQNGLNAGISLPPMLDRDLDKTCIKLFPGLGQVGFSHNSLCLLLKSWRKLIKCRELF